MPLKTLKFKPGVNKENTRYYNESGWYSCDRIRFRQGTPEAIGGWTRLSSNTYLGVCRSLWNWVTLTQSDLLGVGTNSKFYIEQGGTYSDITPLRTTRTTGTLTNPFATTNTSKTVTVTDAAHGLINGNSVIISGVSVDVSGIPASNFNTQFVVSGVTTNTYDITVATAATATASSLGGSVSVTRIKTAVALGANPFATTNGSTTVVVTATSHGARTGDYVTFSGATAVAGLTLNNEYEISYLSSNSYSITAASAATSTTTGGGSAVLAQYQINTGPAIATPDLGWGSGSWGSGAWGYGSSQEALRLWSQSNFGEDLVFAPRGGGLYYWDATGGVTTRGVNAANLPNASNVPTAVNFTTVSDVSRFVFAMGTNDPNASDPTVLDPLLIRWADQESVTNWTPAITNQAGSLRLSHGSEIITAMQARQELVVFTDAAVYSLQYLGAPSVWGANLVGDNISIASPNAVALASGVMYWMGVDKFYAYDGRVNTLSCDLRKYVFNDINLSQSGQIFAGTNEGFNEVWWFYCSSSNNTNSPDRYIIYNYVENVWYYGNLGRTAWLDSGIRDYPMAAYAASSGNLVLYHESAVDDNSGSYPVSLNAYIESAEFDIDDGHNFGFIWRILPDVTFGGSTATSPQVTMSLTPLQNSGSGYGVAVGQAVTRTATYPVEKFTGQIYTRVRGRQLMFKVACSTVGTAWQLGAPRIDVRPDGRR